MASPWGDVWEWFRRQPSPPSMDGERSQRPASALARMQTPSCYGSRQDLSLNVGYRSAGRSRASTPAVFDQAYRTLEGAVGGQVEEASRASTLGQEVYPNLNVYRDTPHPQVTIPQVMVSGNSSFSSMHGHHPDAVGSRQIPLLLEGKPWLVHTLPFIPL